ncbi:MAG: type II TA system antitoxin MqsA family protein [Desulfohalobiaceae bacterium]
MTEMKCPACSNPMELKTLRKQTTIKGVTVEYVTEVFVCTECGLEAGTVQNAGEAQKAIADAYREKMGLLTGSEIKSLRKAKGMSQHQLARAMDVGIASIKRWETGMIQTRAMDAALRRQLQEDDCPDGYTGNREIDLARIKLVARTFEDILGKQLLKEDDRFLFLAKYLWYADMLAYRNLGRSLTGASYAAIPCGPQLNNYKDLLQPIKESDPQQAQELSDEELRIIHRVAEQFPDEEQIYQAAHRERIWQESRMGALIPYSSAQDLQKIEMEWCA